MINDPKKTDSCEESRPARNFVPRLVSFDKFRLHTLLLGILWKGPKNLSVYATQYTAFILE